MTAWKQINLKTEWKYMQLVVNGQKHAKLPAWPCNKFLVPRSPFYVGTLLPLLNVRFQLGWTEQASQSKWVQILSTGWPICQQPWQYVWGALVVLGLFLRWKQRCRGGGEPVFTGRYWISNFVSVCVSVGGMAFQSWASVTLSTWLYDCVKRSDTHATGKSVW